MSKQDGQAEEQRIESVSQSYGDPHERCRLAAWARVAWLSRESGEATLARRMHCWVAKWNRHVVAL